MKIFVAGGTGAIGRPLIAALLAKGHAVVALTRASEKTQALVEQGVEPAIADVFDTDAVKALVRRAQPRMRSTASGNAAPPPLARLPAHWRPLLNGCAC